MKKKIFALNLILIMYILSISTGYAFFSESLTVNGVASTVDFYSGEKLPTTPIKLDTANSRYISTTSVPAGLNFVEESWVDDTYSITYQETSDIALNKENNSTYALSFINPTVLEYTDVEVNPGYNMLDIDIFETDSSSDIIDHTVSVSKTIVAPGESVDVTFNLTTNFSNVTNANETMRATVSYMLQGQRRYFYFKINLIKEKVIKYNTFTIIPTPSDATVTMNGTITNSITLPEGSEVHWTVAKDHYTTQSGTKTIPYVGETAGPLVVSLIESSHNFERITVAPSYSGIGYYQDTCSICGNQVITKISANHLSIIENNKLIDQSAWSNSNITGVALNSGSSFGGTLSYGIVALAVSYVDTEGAAWTGPINLTDAKSITFQYLQWDDLYEKKYAIQQKGRNDAYIGIANSSQLSNNTSFVSSVSHTFTRSSSSESPYDSGNQTIDVSSLTGNYYIKIYTKHSNAGSIVYLKAYTAYTGIKYLYVNYQ